MSAISSFYYLLDLLEERKYPIVAIQDALTNVPRYLVQDIVNKLLAKKSAIDQFDTKEFQYILDNYWDIAGKTITVAAINHQKKRQPIQDHFMTIAMLKCFDNWQQQTDSFDIYLKKWLGNNVRINYWEKLETNKWNFLETICIMKTPYWIIPQYLLIPLFEYIKQGRGDIVPIIIWQLLMSDHRIDIYATVDEHDKNLKTWVSTIEYMFQMITYFKVDNEQFEPFVNTLVTMKNQGIFPSCIFERLVYEIDYDLECKTKVAKYLEKVGVSEWLMRVDW